MVDRGFEQSGRSDAGLVRAPQATDLVDPSMYSRPAAECRLAQKNQPIAKDGQINFGDHGDIYGSQRPLPEKTAEQVKQVEFKSGVSFDFKQSAKEWMQSLPADIVQKTNDAGIRIIFADNAKQVVPNADQMPARGHSNGETIAMQPGFYYPPLKAVVMVQHHDATPGEVRTRASNDAHGVSDFSFGSFNTRKAWHELGHALDYAALKHFTQSSKQFVDAYDKECSTAQDSKFVAQWSYFAHKGNAGSREELFAEIFSLKHNPRPDASQKAMLEHFDGIVKIMQAQKLF
jgi:hypothetical protein